MRHASPQALPARGPSVAPGHVRGGPGLVDEHQPRRVEIQLALEPRLAPLADVGPVLLGGMRRLFLRVILCRRQKRQSALTLTCAPCSAKPAWIRSAWASVRRESRSPPCGLGRASPPARRIACQRMTLDALTPNRAAAWRHDRPSSMAARTRDRTSKDSALGMQVGLPASLCPESDQPRLENPADSSSPNAALVSIKTTFFSCCSSNTSLTDTEIATILSHRSSFRTAPVSATWLPS